MSGIPLPNITWTHNGGISSLASGDDIVLPLATNTIISHGVIQSRLSLEHVTLYDSGQYQCQAESVEYDLVVSNIADLIVIGKYKLLKFYDKFFLQCLLYCCQVFLI